MVIHKITVGPFQMNTYIVHQSPDNAPCVLIDPGDGPQKIVGYLDDKNLKPVAIYNTHGHIDHIRYAGELQRRYDLPFYIGEADAPFVVNLQRQGAAYGMDTAPPPTISSFLQDGHSYAEAGLEFTAIHAPGHSPGSMCFLFDDQLICGDVLFYDSIGRTDLPMGDYDQLLRSIQSRLLTLPDTTVCYPGHGPETTIGREKEMNPFL